MHLADKKGVSKYQHLKQALKSGATIPELAEPSISDGGEYIWRLWLELQHERDYSLSMHPLKVRDIMGYAAAYNLDLNPFEIDALICIDREFIKANGHSKPNNKSR